MKKPTKSIITSSLLAVAFGALSVGSTFALFTSQAKTEIEVASGIVEVSASLSEFTTYSAQEDINGDLVDENGNKYSSVPTAVNHVFTNTGTANYDTSTSVLALERLTPGDRVKLSLEASFGNTNVSIKFRYGIVVDPAKTELAKALDFTIQEGTSAAEPFHGLVSYYSDWIFVSDPAHAEFGPLSFDISMPIKAGNHYQDLETSYLFTLQAVQGNAVTNGEKSFSELEEDVVSEPKAVVENEDTTITAQAKAASFTVTVPTSEPQLTYYEGETQKTIATDDKLTIEVADLGITQETYSTNTSLNFDLTVKVNGEKANNFSKPLDVTVNVGSGKIITSVQHNGTEVTNFQYNSSTGYLSFSSTSFSPFSVDYVDGVEVWNYDQLIKALNNNAVKRIGIKDTIDASAVLEVTRSIEIFGVGAQKTINSTASRILWVDAGNVEVSLSNIHFKGDGVNTERGLQVNPDFIAVTLNLSDVKVTGITYYGINVCSNTTINLNLERCEVEAWGAVNIWSNGFTTTIKDSKLTGWNDKGYNAEGWNDFGVVVCGGDTTHETEASSSDNTIRIINTELVAKATTGNTQYFVLFNLPDKNNTVILDNVVLTSVTENDSHTKVVENTPGNSISGTYTLDGEQGVL